MRFLADMGISPHTVTFLRQKGHAAVHLHEEGLDQITDVAVLRKAREENRVLLTHDLDFGALLAASGAQLPSVVIFRLHDMRPANVNKHLQHILESYEEKLHTGVIISLTEKRVRVRTLPLRTKD